MMTADTSLSTVPRILSHLCLTSPRRHTPMARALIDDADVVSLVLCVAAP